MFVVAIHDISDPDGFWSAADPSLVPAEVTLHSTYPSSDGRHATCLWEAESVDAVHDFLEPILGPYGRNDYFEVDPQHRGALGLPVSAAVAD